MVTGVVTLYGTSAQVDIQLSLELTQFINTLFFLDILFHYMITTIYKTLHLILCSILTFSCGFPFSIGNYAHI